MATPAKTVQFRHTESLLQMYHDTGVAPFAIKVGGNLCHKYEGEDLEEGYQILEKMCKLIVDNESAGIYTLCLYERMPEDGITDKTPCGYSWNFRFMDHATNYVAGPEGRDLYSQVNALKAEIAALKAEREEPHKLGMIGDILEMEAFQPIIMGIAHKVADWVTGDNKVGELKRVSGIPGLTPEPIQSGTGDWQEDPLLCQAIERLQKKVPDLPAVLDKLACMAENSPGMFAMYLAMIRKKK